nr:ribonuclease H-like domain-containing protein [Tanacetum cinerariifolium]
MKPPLVTRRLPPQSEALDLIAENFNDNKHTRSIALNAELRSLKLCGLTIDAYFRFPDKYDNVSGIIVHREPFPDLKRVRSMLTTKETRLKSMAQATSIDSTSSSHMVLLANSGPSKCCSGKVNESMYLEGIDVDETFSLVVKPDTIRTVLSLATSRHCPVHQLDVNNAFLHGDLSQTVYMHHPLILERAHMVNCNPSQTPIDTKSKLGDDGDLVSDPTLYWSLAGSLLYLTSTHLDISYTMQQRQPTLFRSSAETEYRGVANVVAETCWLRNLLRELYTHLSSATLVYCDNVSVVYPSSNPVQHQRTKHIEIDIYFVCDLVAAG